VPCWGLWSVSRFSCPTCCVCRGPDKPAGGQGCAVGASRSDAQRPCVQVGPAHPSSCRWGRNFAWSAPPTKGLPIGRTFCRVSCRCSREAPPRCSSVGSAVSAAPTQVNLPSGRLYRIHGNTELRKYGISATGYPSRGSRFSAGFLSLAPAFCSRCVAPVWAGQWTTGHPVASRGAARHCVMASGHPGPVRMSRSAVRLRRG
jgi:hypothetical protein